MKSTVKIDVDGSNNPIIKIKLIHDESDLRDKMLNRFIYEVRKSGTCSAICTSEYEDGQLNQSVSNWEISPSNTVESKSPKMIRTIRQFLDSNRLFTEAVKGKKLESILDQLKTLDEFSDCILRIATNTNIKITGDGNLSMMTMYLDEEDLSAFEDKIVYLYSIDASKPGDKIELRFATV